jgi:GH15 family glucan-1,4-alpha-glucosidase
MILNEIETIKNSSVENGAIIAADTDNPLYPTEATSYRYVWISDASFICVAADVLGIKNMQERFFEWCATKPEGFNETGLFYQKYHTNGRKADYQYQPHQAGLLVWAIAHYYKLQPNRFNNLVEKIAKGIVNVWDYDHFSIETYNIWEDKRTFPDLKDNHVLSLASSIYALKSAGYMLRTHRWFDTIIEMEVVLNKTTRRTLGVLPDSTENGTFSSNLKVDTSLLGLVYPFNVLNANDIRMVNLVDSIENKLVNNGLVKRYEGDKYDGWLYEGKSRFKGASAWPLLSFWMSIYQIKKGNIRKANYYYKSVIEKLKGYNFIPEQFGRVELPLNWATAMYVIAREMVI